MARTKCNICNIRSAAKDTNGQCNPCFEEGGWENTHSDYDHDNIIAGNVVFGYTTHKTEVEFEKWLADEKDSMAHCWICHPELNLAQKPAKPSVASKNAGFTRRTQLNHKEMCTHAQTPKARRTCKNAFWAGVQVMVTEGKLTEDQAWEHCIKSLAANQAANAELQALETAPKPTKATGYTLVSTGPKHGVVKQLKAAKPAAKGKFLTKAEGMKLNGKG